MAAQPRFINTHSITDFLFKAFRRGLDKLVEISDYGLPVAAWKSTRSVMVSILLATLLINILSLAFPLALLQVYDRIIPNQATVTLTLLVIGVGVALILVAVLRVIRSYVGAWADAKFEHLVSCKAFGKLVDSSMPDFEKVGAGEHLKHLNSLSTLRDFYAGQAISSFVDVPFVFVFLALIAYVAGWLVLVPLGMVILFMMLAFRYANTLQHLLKSRQVQDERRLNFIVETLGNIHSIKATTMEAQMLRRYERLQRTTSSNDYRVSLDSSLTMARGATLSQTTIILVVAFGAVLVMHGQLTIGGLAACTLLSGRCLQPINAVVGLWNRLQSIRIARDELEEVLEMPQESGADLPEFPPMTGDIEYRNVTFRYRDDLPVLLKDFNFKVKANETISITGEGFTGKSTLLWLLLGFYPPEKGEILIDNKNINAFDLKSIRDQIAYFPQTGKLFQGTILDNLTMFENDEYYDRAVEVAEMVGLEKIIEQFPDGLYTKVGNQSVENLPRGIKQRITIARALVKKPKIILFDEANTAVDMAGDDLLKEMLLGLKGEATMLLISHRPSILNIADRKYEFEGGQLKEVKNKPNEMGYSP